MSDGAIAFISYITLAGLVSFILFGIDKRKANKQKWRISEKTLLWSVGLGGWLGGIIGMSYFRHKTIKVSFLWRFWVLVVAWGILTIIALILG